VNLTSQGDGSLAANAPRPTFTDSPKGHPHTGEIYCVLDEDEILLKPFDTVIVQGVNHGWSNRGTEPCLLIGVLLDAQPRH
jgi:hypothetical protein